MGGLRDEINAAQRQQEATRECWVQENEQRIARRRPTILAALEEFFDVAAERGHSPFTVWRCHTTDRRWLRGTILDLEPVAAGYPLDYRDIDSRGGWWSSITWPTFVTREGVGYGAAPRMWSATADPPRITTRQPGGAHARHRPPVCAILLTELRGDTWMAPEGDWYDDRRPEVFTRFLLRALNHLGELEQEAARVNKAGMLRAC